MLVSQGVSLYREPGTRKADSYQGATVLPFTEVRSTCLGTQQGTRNPGSHQGVTQELQRAAIGSLLGGTGEPGSLQEVRMPLGCQGANREPAGHQEARESLRNYLRAARKPARDELLSCNSFQPSECLGVGVPSLSLCSILKQLKGCHARENATIIDISTELSLYQLWSSYSN